MSGNKSRVIALNYFGSKFSHLDSLYNNFPNDFIHLIDLFGGSFSVTLNFKGKQIITANEINGEITNFFEVLRNNMDELIYLLLLTPCSNKEFDNCWQQTDNKVEQARRFYVRHRQSFFNLSPQKKNKGWNIAKTTLNVQRGEMVSKWNNSIEKLIVVAELIRNNFQILNCDYQECIKKLDFEKAFFYADPPYLESVRKTSDDYEYEFTQEQHIKLSRDLHGIKGLAMISSYECELYNDLYADWRKIKLKSLKNNIRGQPVQEVIWMNYPEQNMGLFNNY